MNFFKKIGQGFKKTFEAISDVAEKVVEDVSNVAEKVIDVAGDITEGVTRAVAGDKAADKVKNSFDNIIEPAIKRTVKGVASVIATPLAALDDIAQKGLVDGITKHVVDGGQDVIGGTTRFLAGQKAEEKFDKVFDEKIQPYVEMIASTAGRAALCLVPGGQIGLIADAASEVGSLGIRAANDEKLGAMDYIGAGASFLGIGASVTGSAIKNTASAVTKTADDVAINAVKSTDDVVASGVKQADNVALSNTDKTKYIATAVTGEVAADQAITIAMREYAEAKAKKGTAPNPDTPLPPAASSNSSVLEKPVEDLGGYAMPVNTNNGHFNPENFRF